MNFIEAKLMESQSIALFFVESEPQFISYKFGIHKIALDLDRALAAPKEYDNSTDRQLLDEMGKDIEVPQIPTSVVVIKEELRKGRPSQPQEVPRYEQLYQLSKVLRDRSAERKKQLEKSLTFRPDISLSANSTQYYSRPMSLSFNERMEEDIKIRAERSRNRELIRDSVGNSSGKPRTSSNSQNRSEAKVRSHKLAYQDLHDLAAAKLERRSFIRKQVDKHLELARSARKINDASLNMVETLEKQKIEELFRTLDHDHDGLISAQRIGIDNISNSRLAIICPLLEEMQFKEVALDIGAFSRAMGRLLGRISIHQRRCLLGLETEKAHNCGVGALPTFRPHICPNTNRILQRAKSPADRRSLSEEKYKKMMQEIESKKQQDEAECRFKPQLLNRGYKVSKSAYSSVH